MKKILSMISCIAVLVLSSLILIVLTKALRQPQLILKESTVQIKQGEYFDAGSYVQTYHNGTLVLPSVETDTSGTKAAVYRLVGENREVAAVLIVEIRKK
ncbi:MAG: hypothetical protein ACI32N_08195 [Bulleidia sp.]